MRKVISRNNGTRGCERSRYSGKKFKRSKLPWRKNVFKLFSFVLALSTVKALRLIDSISFPGKMERSLNSIKSRVKITIIALDIPAMDSHRNRQRNLSRLRYVDGLIGRFS